MFKIFMGRDLEEYRQCFEKNEELIKEAELYKKSAEVSNAELELIIKKKTDELKNSMQKALIESDIQREKAIAKVEVYESLGVDKLISSMVK